MEKLELSKLNKDISKYDYDFSLANGKAELAKIMLWGGGQMSSRLQIECNST